MRDSTALVRPPFLLLGWVALCILIGCSPATSQRRPSKPIASSPIPEPAIPAILAAFDRYEVVAMPEGHDMKDVDDLILALIRDPGFPDRVDDIVVECGNSLYQPVLDQYIAGMDVPFADVRKVWRNTTQEMCGFSSFFEQFFPLVRAINQKLPPAKRLRVLAGDPPIDWEQITSPDDARKFLDRDPGIASIMEKEVLSKHRKALMLFGTFHLFHGMLDGHPRATSAPPSAVSLYEKDYPGRTFVISDLGIYDASRLRTPAWPNPGLIQTRGTWLGALSLNDIISPPISTHDCHVTVGFPPNLQRPMDTLVDGLLYLGPQDFALNEPIPADIALDTAYMAELSRRESLIGPPGAPVESPQELRNDIIHLAQDPIREPPPVPNVRAIEQSCHDRAQP